MAAILERMQDRLDLMQRTRSIAIVGMSKNSSRSSHFVASYLAVTTDLDVYVVHSRIPISHSPRTG